MRYHRFEGDRSIGLRSILVTVLVCSFLAGAILYMVWPKISKGEQAPLHGISLSVAGNKDPVLTRGIVVARECSDV